MDEETIEALAAEDDDASLVLQFENAVLGISFRHDSRFTTTEVGIWFESLLVEFRRVGHSAFQ